MRKLRLLWDTLCSLNPGEAIALGMTNFVSFGFSFFLFSGSPTADLMICIIGSSCVMVLAIVVFLSVVSINKNRWP